jgi:hypothetical protein
MAVHRQFAKQDGKRIQVPLTHAVGPELQKKIVDGVLEEVDGRSIEALSQERDTLILGLLELLSHRGRAEPVAAPGDTGG